MSGKARLGKGMAFGGSSQPKLAGLDEDAVNADINVTPMIDVMLVLLIIFMVVTPALAGYTAVLPKAEAAESEKEDRVMLGISNEGLYYLDEKPQPVPEDQLVARFQQLYASRPEDHILYLKADQGVEYSVVLTAIDAAREAGVRRIATITDPLIEEEN